MSKYLHTEDLHNLKSPKEIVPVIYEIIKPKSVIDVGCGIGTFLHCFKNSGVKNVLGIDGSWVDESLRKKYLNDNEFIIKDLEQPIILNNKFDLVISLEVAEHLKEDSSDTFIESLTALGDIILFSAAIPNQGGQNHINEKWPSYWHEKFKLHNFFIHDILRPIFWNNDNIFWWYKQNLLLFLKEGVNINSDILNQYPQSPMYNIVHPGLLLNKVRQVNKLKEQLKKYED